jgi:hypothetical protein
MTTRKSKGKGKRNGRTKRGGFLNMFKDSFKDSFSWFGESEKAKTDQTAETKTGSSEGGWFSNLINKFKPPTITATQTPVIPGRPPAPLSPQQQSLSPQQQQSLSSAASLSPQQQSQVITPSSQKPQVITPSSQKPQVITPSSQTQPQMQPQAPVTAAAAGGKRRRNRVSAKKRK